MSTTYLTQTPYHIILASAMASSDPKPRTLYVIKDFNTKNLGSVLKNYGNFESVKTIPGQYNNWNNIHSRAKLLLNIFRFQIGIRLQPPQILVVFNDRRPDIQAALSACPPNTIIVYAEDGSGAYSSFRHPKRTGLTHLKRKLAYGYWHENPRVPGTSSWIEKVRATNPKYLRPELKKYPTEKISSTSIKDLKNKNWIQKYMSQSEYNMDDLLDIDILIAPSLSRFSNSVSGYNSAYENIFKLASKINLSVALKYHPRETREYLLTDHYNIVTVIPNRIPFELLLLMVEENTIVLGDMSTVLLTARTLTESKVVSIAPLLNIPSRDLIEVFEMMDIHVYEKWDEIEMMLYRHGND